MIVDESTLERLSGAGPDAFAEALAAVGAHDRAQVLAVIDAASEWAWDAPVAAGRVAAGCRTVAANQRWDAAARAGYVEARGALAGGDVEGARRRLTDARATFSTLGDTARLRQVSLGLAHVEAVAGRFEAARIELLAVIGPDQSGPFADRGSIEERAIRAKARQNLAALDVMSGSYDSAVVLLRDAEATYLDLGMRREWIDAVNNRALALLGLGRTADAARAIEVAMPQLASDEVRDARAELLDTAARAHLLAGRIAAAIDRLSEALVIARSADAPERAAHIELALADAWSTLRLHDDALAAYRSVLDWAASAGATALASWAELGVGVSLIGLDRRDDGEPHLREAFDRLTAERQLSGAISAGLALAAVLVAPAESAATLDRALALGDAAQRPADQVCLELAAFDAGRGARHLDAAQRITDDLAVPRLRYEVDLRRARALRTAGDTGRALAALRRATEQIESTRGELVSERHRRAYLSDRLEAHAELVRTLVELGDPEHLREAFAVAERARSRALLDAMSGIGGARGTDQIDGDAAERLEQFSRDLESLYNGLLGDEELRGMPVVAGDLAALEVAIESSAGADGLVGQADVVGLEELQRSLAGVDATLISYHTIAERLVAFVVRADLFEVRVLPCERSEVLAEARRLDAQLARFRVGQEFAERWSSRLLDGADAALAGLAHLVLDPIADLLAGSCRLVVVPCREVRTVPFAALPFRARRVVDEVAVVTAPSASSWARCQATAPAVGRPVLVAVADTRAPSVDTEVTAVAELLPAAAVFKGASATRAAVLAAVSASPPPSALHLACHGMFHPGHAMFSAVRLADGWVTAHELATGSLTGAMVALSACESGRFAVQAGDEVVGLPRALLVAGARDVVASSWLAHDAATAHLMSNFYAGFADGGDPAAALRDAQLAVRELHPHPFHWAAFSVLGAGWRSLMTPSSPASFRASTTGETIS
jgi:CHAT domain-containing protein/tetratricopeptide (TPR) repeat protein